MKAQLNFEIATLAREKNFEPGTLTTNFTNKYLLGGKKVMITELCINLWLFELQKWLRDTHNIVITVASIFKDETCKEIQYWWWIQGHEEDNDENEVYFKTYEEALEAALQEALKLI